MQFDEFRMAAPQRLSSTSLIFSVSKWKYLSRYLTLFSLLCCTVPLCATTWYVRPDGGTRYSANRPTGQCNGQANAPYPGTGVNQACAFGDVRYLWADGSYATGKVFPAWGWVGAGGDTYIVDCPNDCRVGFSGPNSGPTDYFLGIAGNPYGSGSPAPPNGTAATHTRILGSNFANCSSDGAKARINGGYGVGGVFNLKGASYVDLACLNITDHSSCGRAGQAHQCHINYPLDDYATNGIVTNNKTTNVTITDVRVHGMSVSGMLGATGDQVVLERVALVGNASSGWNLDDGSATTGSGSLSLNRFSVLWNGCAEEYPLRDPLPYQDCTDDNSGGYGDGMGTATITSNPAWHMNVSHSVAAYNTQDGFDLLHLQGGGSSLTITSSLAYGNMGQQLKVGAASVSRNNLLVGNCNALRMPIPGTPTGYNSRLSDFCRAADTAVLVKVQDSLPTYFQFNTLYSANATGLEIDCNGTCSGLSTIAYENNVFVGFMNDANHGYPKGGSGSFANPIYLSVAGLFAHSGSVFGHNVTYHPKSNWTCPAIGHNETDAVCGDPQLNDETWHLYGYGDMSPVANSTSLGKGVEIGGVIADYNDARRPNPPAIGALEFGANPVGEQVVLDVSPNPALSGQLVSMVASVENTARSVPTGAVMFLNGNTSLGSAPLDNLGRATLEPSTLLAGPNYIMAVYSGDEVYPPWGSGITPIQVMSPTTTTLSVTATVVYGKSLSLTATVKGSTSAVPPGTVTFFNGSTALGTATLSTAGTATLVATSLPVGNLGLLAKFSGSGNFVASNSPVVKVSVTPESTTTTLVSSSSTVVYGKPISLTATVRGSGSGVPTGTVTFLNGSNPLGAANVSASGTSTLSLGSLTVGSHTLTAWFSGNADFLGSLSSGKAVTITKQ